MRGIMASAVGSLELGPIFVFQSQPQMQQKKDYAVKLKTSSRNWLGPKPNETTLYFLFISNTKSIPKPHFTT